MWNLSKRIKVCMWFFPYLCEYAGVRAPSSGCAGGLDVQVLVVYERPGALHSTCLELFVKGADMRVSKHPAVQVLWDPALPLHKALLIKASVPWKRGLGQGPRLSRGACFGAAVLYEQVLDALHSRVVGQVSTARSGRPLGAECVGPQCAAVDSISSLLTPSSNDTNLKSRSHEIRVASQDSTLCTYCRERKLNYHNVNGSISRIHLIYVTWDHTTCHKGTFFEIEIYTTKD